MSAPPTLPFSGTATRTEKTISEESKIMECKTKTTDFVYAKIALIEAVSECQFRSGGNVYLYEADILAVDAEALTAGVDAILADHSA